MKTSEKTSGGRKVKNGITLHALIQKESEEKAARKLQAKHKAHEKVLKPYKADDKTVFYSESPEKAARTIAEYKRRQINYKQI